MIETLDVARFRGFEKTSLSGLQQVNILVGDNGSGKTALMEAIFVLSSGNPAVAIGFFNWRGITIPAMANAPYDSLWGSLFYDFDMTGVATLRMQGSVGHVRTLEIARLPAPQLNLPLTGQGRPEISTSGNLSGSIPVQFSWTTDKGQTVKVVPTIISGSLNISGAPSNVRTGFVSAWSAFSDFSVVNIFSELSRHKEDIPVIEEIKKEFPQIENINQETDSGGPQLYASLVNKNTKQPLGLVSQGLTRMFMILLQIAKCEGGILLVDEIENGIYHKHQEQFWAMVLRFAKGKNVQLFVSTHSKECLEAARMVARDNPALFSLIKTEKNGNGSCSATCFSGQQLFDAIDQEIDPR